MGRWAEWIGRVGVRRHFGAAVLSGPLFSGHDKLAANALLTPFFVYVPSFYVADLVGGAAGCALVDGHLHQPAEFAIGVARRRRRALLLDWRQSRPFHAAILRLGRPIGRGDSVATLDNHWGLNDGFELVDVDQTSFLFARLLCGGVGLVETTVNKLTAYST